MYPKSRTGKNKNLVHLRNMITLSALKVPRYGALTMTNKYTMNTTYSKRMPFCQHNGRNGNIDQVILATKESEAEEIS